MIKIRSILFVLITMLTASTCSLPTSSPQPTLVTSTRVSPTPFRPATATASPTPTQPTPTPTATIPPVSTLVYPPGGLGPGNFPANVNPLTGQMIEDPNLLERRPIGIKINNYPRTNRPQWGLSLADLVFEYYHNNELTRFHAIFYGHDAEIAGPIRSARPFDDYLVSIYKSNFAFASADYRVLERLESQDYADRLVFLLSGQCPPRPVCRYAPQTVNYLVGSTSAIGDYVVDRGVDNARQDLNGMVFSPDVPSGGQEANRLYVRYSYAAYLYWNYNADLGRYIRYQDTQEDIRGRGEGYHLLTDRLTEQPITASNVVILVIPHFHLLYRPPSSGKPAVEIVDMRIGASGPAFALRDGRIFQVSWVRPDDGSVIYLVNPDGSPYTFKPGPTWFQVLGEDPPIESSQGRWRFLFVLR